MSAQIPGLEEDLPQLTGVSEGASSIATVPLGQETASRDSPHLRFQIEDVHEELSPIAHSSSHPHSTPPLHDVTISSFGYNTAEAVPMTMYYRHGEEVDGGAKTRPSLDHLRERINLQASGQPGAIALQAEEEGEEGEDVGDDSSTSPRKWWQCCKKRPATSRKKEVKFGWIQGVLVRCLLNIWGVMLFIRLSWVVGQAGIGLAVVIVLLSGVVTTITTLSMSAICTNGEVKGGGAYYLISRSLGPQFGGAIGIVFSLANAVAVALYVVGFAETVTELLMDNNLSITGSSQTNDIRVIGVVVVLLLLGVALIGLDWEAKVQIVLLVILLLAIADFIIGTFLPPHVKNELYYINDIELQGYTWYSGDTFITNFVPAFRTFEGTEQSFFTVFAVFFPAATGILAGANISGDLKNPQTAIPKGTFLAIAITTFVYVLMAIMVGMIFLRDAPGEFFFSGLETNATNCSNDTLISLNIFPPVNSCSSVYDFAANFPDCNCTLQQCSEDLPFCVDGSGVLPTEECILGDKSPSVLEEICGSAFLGLVNRSSCDFGLLNHLQVMALVSAWSPVVTAGIFAATLSSALASLVSAPKVFQRVCQDKIFPYIVFFAKGGGRSGTEPIRAYFLTLVIALACIAIGELNQIAEIISTFFLMAYALINFACFAASVAKSPGWRPAFRYYNQWVALFGALLCVAIMFVIRWYFAFVTIIVVIALYLLVDFLKPDINWGSSTQAFLYSYSLRNLLKLEKLGDHVKNFRPQFLVLTGPPSSRPDMVHFFDHISREVGVMVCGHVLLGEYTENRTMLVQLSEQQRKWLRREKIKAFYNAVSAMSLKEGVRSMLQLSGLGKLRPNTMVIGYKGNWTKCQPQEVEDYVTLLHDAFDLKFGVVLFRLRAGFDATEKKDATGENPEETVGGHAHIRAESSTSSPTPKTQSLRHRGSTGPLLEPAEQLGAAGKYTEIPLMPIERSPMQPQDTYQLIGEEVEDKSSLRSYDLAIEGSRLRFEDEEEEVVRRRVSSTPSQEGPELVTMPSRFERVQEKGTIDVWWIYDEGGLAILLPYLLSRHKIWKNCKLRIFTAASSRDIDRAKLRMTTLLQKFRISFSEVIEVPGINQKPSSESLDKYQQLPLGPPEEDSKELDKLTNRHIRLGELLREHSSNARMIVITITVPPHNISAHRYMSWLETMSHDLPPILLMRGNQTSVLTFYS